MEQAAIPIYTRSAPLPPPPKRTQADRASPRAWAQRRKTKLADQFEGGVSTEKALLDIKIGIAKKMLKSKAVFIIKSCYERNR